MRLYVLSTFRLLPSRPLSYASLKQLQACRLSHIPHLHSLVSRTWYYPLSIRRPRNSNHLTRVPSVREHIAPVAGIPYLHGPLGDYHRLRIGVTRLSRSIDHHQRHLIGTWCRVVMGVRVVIGGITSTIAKSPAVAVYWCASVGSGVRCIKINIFSRRGPWRGHRKGKCSLWCRRSHSYHLRLRTAPPQWISHWQSHGKRTIPLIGMTDTGTVIRILVAKVP